VSQEPVLTFWRKQSEPNQMSSLSEIDSNMLTDSNTLTGSNMLTDTIVLLVPPRKCEERMSTMPQPLPSKSFPINQS
jgi:hypothetical protein